MDMGELFDPACRGPGGASCKCEDCEEGRRYCYWNHDHGDGRPKQFLLFASDNKDSQCIPWEVSSQLRNMIPNSEPIKLETPDGHTYDVGFIKFSLITLTTGWRGFVDANHIRQGDPMLFVYCGNSTFKVRVFDSSGHDKFLSCSQPPCRHDVMNVIGEGTRKSCRRQKWVPGYAAHKTHDRASVRLEVGFRPSQRPYILPLGVTLHGQVKKEVEEKVQSILSELPIFVKVMTSSTVDGVGSTKSSLAFCQEYIRASLRGITGTIYLQLEGGERKWRTTLSVRGDTTKTIAGGWKEFARDNHLEMGDVCLFQMQKGIPRSHTMTVHLICKSETEQ